MVDHNVDMSIAGDSSLGATLDAAWSVISTMDGDSAMTPAPTAGWAVSLNVAGDASMAASPGLGMPVECAMDGNSDFAISYGADVPLEATMSGHSSFGPPLILSKRIAPQPAQPSTSTLPLRYVPPPVVTHNTSIQPPNLRRRRGE